MTSKTLKFTIEINATSVNDARSYNLLLSALSSAMRTIPNDITDENDREITVHINNLLLKNIGYIQF